MNVPEMLASLQRQRNILETVVPALEQLAQLQGDNPLHTISLNGHKPKGKKKAARKTAPKAAPKEAGGTATSFVLRALGRAKLPLSTAEITSRMLGLGWRTTSPDPKAIVTQALVKMWHDKRLKKIGKRPNMQFALPEWSAATEAHIAYTNAAKPKRKTLHWTQRPENKSKVDALLHKAKIAKAKAAKEKQQR